MLMNIARLLIKKMNTSMNKYIKKFVPGFTITEILISLTISSLLVAAMVPIVGVKKVKRPNVRKSHGVAECYYDSSGQLKAYIGSYRREGDIVFRAANGRCELVVPPLRYMQIYVIGAGSNSSGNTITSVSRVNRSYNGDINISNNYQEDIAAAEDVHAGLSDMIRQALNNWPGGLNAIYRITSPIGNGGQGKCQAVRISDSETCNSLCSSIDNGYCKGPLTGSGRFYSVTQAQAINTSDYCWAYIHGKGQASGSGLTKTFTVPINASSQMNITESGSKSGVAVLNGTSVKDIYFSASGNGRAPVFVNDGYEIQGSAPASSQCTSSDSSNCADAETKEGNPGSDGGQEPVMGFGCTDYLTNNARAKAGKVEYSKPTLSYSYTPVVYMISQPYGGKQGQIVSNVYEKMSGTLYLYPARNTSESSRVIKKNATSNLLSAASGTNVSSRTENIDVSRSELPIVTSSKKLAKANNDLKLENEAFFEDYLSKINSMAYNGGLKNCQNNGSCPGFAGNGAYLYISGSGLNNINTLTITNHQQSNSVYTHKADTKIHSNASNCDAGDTKVYITSESNINLYYCKPGRTNGNPGAVIIIW